MSAMRQCGTSLVLTLLLCFPGSAFLNGGQIGSAGRGVDRAPTESSDRHLVVKELAADRAPSPRRRWPLRAPRPKRRREQPQPLQAASAWPGSASAAPSYGAPAPAAAPPAAAPAGRDPAAREGGDGERLTWLLRAAAPWAVRLLSLIHI